MERHGNQEVGVVEASAGGQRQPQLSAHHEAETVVAVILYGVHHTLHRALVMETIQRHGGLQMDTTRQLALDSVVRFFGQPRLFQLGKTVHTYLPLAGSQYTAAGGAGGREQHLQEGGQDLAHGKKRQLSP